MLGAIDSIINHVPEMLGVVAIPRAERNGWAQAAEFASLILDAGWAWAAAAVLAGWLVSRHLRSRRGLLRGAAAGVLTLVFATADYYATDVIFDGDTWWGTTTRYWMIGAVLFGPALGVFGALIRRPGWTGALAALVVPAGAALQMILRPPPPESLMAQPVCWTVWTAAAVVAVLVAHRTISRPRPVSEVDAGTDRPAH